MNRLPLSFASRLPPSQTWSDHGGSWQATKLPSRREPAWEPPGRTTSHASRTSADGQLAIRPAHEPIRTTLNGHTGIYGSEGSAPVARTQACRGSRLAPVARFGSATHRSGTGGYELLDGLTMRHPSSIDGRPIAGPEPPSLANPGPRLMEHFQRGSDS